MVNDLVKETEDAIKLPCPFCNTNNLTRYDVVERKVRCTKCDIVISTGIVFRGIVVRKLE